ncbi:MAG: SagB/ThcOx family dehydrogenase [Candidatus Neomarinimicrobiota bacterium]
MLSKLPGLAIQLVIGLALMISFGVAQEASAIKLLAPQLNSGKLLMQALKERQSMRNFSEKPLALPALSNLLWAANGINRPESGKRTAPTAMNRQEIDVYVVLPEGIYLYDPKEHVLKIIASGDFRKLCGRQDFVAKAPVNLIYVADYAKMGSIEDETKKFYAATDAGFVAQNVYLFCASEGLACVVRGMVDRDALAKAMRLKPDHNIILAHTIGYPAE